MSRTTEFSITEALRKRYSDHIFASQVKLGSAGTKIIDAVAIKKTWTPVTAIGFEIKVSRYDFVNDNKYPEYMKACTNFYFVVPNGIIKDDEIPKEVGLMIYYPDSGTLKIKKKAPYLNNEVSTEMLLHIMFWKFEKYNAPKTRQEYLDDLKAKMESQQYGIEIAMKISNLEDQLKRKSYRDEWLSFQEEFNNKYGYRPSSWEVMNLIPDDLQAVKDVRLIRGSIENLYKRLFQNEVKA
jgi:hypothetical protein